MSVLHVDFETFCELPIKKVGAWAYTAHPSFEILCAAFAFDDETPWLWLPGQPLPRAVSVHIGSGGDVEAWSAHFEWLTMHRAHNWPGPKPTMEQMQCSQALASTFSLPRELGAACEARGLDEMAKDKAGRHAVQKVTKSRRPSKHNSATRWTLENAPADFEALHARCMKDVASERALVATLPASRLTETQRDVYLMDFRMNARGVPVDLESIKNAVEMTAAAHEREQTRVTALTGGEVPNVNARDAVLAWLDAQGHPLPDYQADTIRASLDADTLPESVRAVLSARLELSRAATKKLEPMQRAAVNGRVHGMVLYYGADTGRWAGRLVQLHNFKRGKDPHLFIDLLNLGGLDLLDLAYDRPMDALGDAMRGFICAPAGREFLIADYAMIEVCVLFWLAGEDEAVAALHRRDPIYEQMAADIFGCAVEDVDSLQRLLGKIATLGCGYQMWAERFLDTCHGFGATWVDEALATRAVKTYRRKRKKVVRLWSKLEALAIRAMKTPGRTLSYRHLAFHHTRDRKWLHLRLPSGRWLSYPDPLLDPQGGRSGLGSVSYMTRNSLTGRWERVHSYGGKWTENATQAVACDLMCHGMLEAEREGYPPFLTVHDEVGTEIDEGTGDVTEFENTLCRLPAWADGIPLRAEGFRTKRYRKG